MRVNRRLLILGAILLPAAYLEGEALVRQDVYKSIEASPNYGHTDFASGPSLVRLGTCNIPGTKVKKIDLKLPSSVINLPAKVAVRTFREFAIEKTDTTWVSTYLFGEQSISMRDVKIVFPRAVGKSMSNCIVAEACLREYPLRVLVEREFPVGDKYAARSLGGSDFSVASSVFVAPRMICYGRVNGQTLSSATTEEMLKERIK